MSDTGSPNIRWPLAGCLICTVAALASLPAILGDWVYDDRILPWHPMLDGFDDVWRAWGRTSAAYLDLVASPGATPVATGTTYRPLPMISLAATNALLGAEPLWHHAVSTLFHACSVVLLAKLFAQAGQLRLRGWVVVSVFALHAGIGEAYCWINGRSDVMAGVCLLMLAVAQLQPSSRRARTVLSVLSLAAGALCKETFLVASFALLVALHVPSAERTETRSRGERALLAAAWLSTALAVMIGRFLAGARAGSVPDIELAKLIAQTPRLIALAGDTLLWPRASSMRLLSWELVRPWHLGEVMALLVFVISALQLARTGRFRQLVLLLGAAATVLPALLIAGGFWFGFDRYLYMPACLLALCSLPAQQAQPQSTPRTQHLGRAALLASIGLLSIVQWQASAAYASHRAWVSSMIELRPEDPSGYLLAAQEALGDGKVARARRLLLALPIEQLPVPHAHRAIDSLLLVNEVDRAAQVAESTLERRGSEPRILLGLATVRAQQGRWDQALPLYRRVLEEPSKRATVRATLAKRLQLQLARNDVPAAVQAQLRALHARAAAP